MVIMIFNYNYEINIKKIFNLTNLKRLSILDFGCGTGIWPSKNLDKKINEIILYDNNKKLLFFLKKKYKNKNVKINFNLNKIIKNKNYNIILLSSVIQYISKSDLRKIIYKLTKNKKKIFIVITDIPYLPRFIEFILLPIFNLKRFIFVLKIIFSKNYRKINYYTYKKSDFNLFKKNFKIKFIPNLHDLNFLRYSLVLKIKKI